MRTLLIFVPFIFLQFGYGQKVVLSNLKLQEAFTSIDNYLEIGIEHTDCDSIIVRTDNGIITGDQCLYRYRPEYPGIATLTISRISQRDTVLVAARKLRVKKLPLPRASLSRKDQGIISVKELKAQLGIIATIEDLDLGLHCPVTEYRLIVIRDGALVGMYDNKGARFEAACRSLLERVRAGDVVYFVEIYALTLGGERMPLNALSFQVQVN